MGGADRPIIIVGGGLGGLTTALALGRAGRRVRILEQAPAFGAIGYGCAELGELVTAVNQINAGGASYQSYYNAFLSLAQRIGALADDELAALRKKADRRHRNLVRLGIAALLGVAALGLLAFLKFNRQEEHAARQEEHAATVETMSAASSTLPPNSGDTARATAGYSGMKAPLP